jgi:hypothetical protein
MIRNNRIVVLFVFIIKPRNALNTYVARDAMSKYQKPRNKISTKISLSVYPRKLIKDDTTGLHNNSKTETVLHVVINLYFTAAFMNMGVLRTTTVLIVIAVSLFSCVASHSCYAPPNFWGSVCRYV